MKHYYYAENDQQLGPFTLDELKTKRLKRSTLVWTDGMENWASANDIDDLKDILISEPPPLPKKKSVEPIVEIIQTKQSENHLNSKKYDLSYEKDIQITVVGVLLLVISIVLYSITLPFETEESYNLARVLFAIISLSMRIAITIWVVKIATEQNRNSSVWGGLAFFIPSIVLIIIGQLKKLRFKIELDSSLPIYQQIEILRKKAYQFFSVERFPECVEILNKAIELDSQEFSCIKLRGQANYKIENYQIAKVDFETLLKNDKYHSEANFYLGNMAMKDGNRELAISFWEKAVEYNNEDAKVELARFQ